VIGQTWGGRHKCKSTCVIRSMRRHTTTHS
jgi:hypothetical protein